VSHPIPLATPDGEVLLYACGTCGEAQHPVSGPNREKVREWSLLEAQRCCVCRRCGTALEPRNWLRLCQSCEAQEQAEQEAHTARMRPEWERQARERDESFARSPDPDVARLLMQRMSDISEECWCAGWLIRLEYILWEMVAADAGREFGQGVVKPEEVAELRRLSERCGGWIVWDSDRDGEIWVPREEWERHYAAAQAGRAVE
jgi:hypothetical protein